MRELSLHILDLARNSLEAGATEVALTVVEDPDSDSVQITVADNGRGMDAETLARVCDPFFTTRETRAVGLGLALFRATCERCGGGMEVTSEPGVGTVVRGWLQQSHLDRPPLGDMGAVLQSLAVESGQVRLRYEHRSGTATFVVDSCDLQEELGGVALNSAPALVWLRAHVRESLREIGSQG